MVLAETKTTNPEWQITEPPQATRVVPVESLCIEKPRSPGIIEAINQIPGVNIHIPDQMPLEGLQPNDIIVDKNQRTYLVLCVVNPPENGYQYTQPPIVLLQNQCLKDIDDRKKVNAPDRLVTAVLTITPNNRPHFHFFPQPPTVQEFVNQLDSNSDPTPFYLLPPTQTFHPQQ